MKVGYRKPSIKKSLKARTTGKMKRKVKKAVNPFYGKKGVGYVKNPKKAVYNKVYHKTTFGTSDAVRYVAGNSSKGKNTAQRNTSTPSTHHNMTRSTNQTNVSTSILLALWLFYPLGVYWLWKKGQWHDKIKAIFTIVFSWLFVFNVLLFIGMAVSQQC